MTRFLAFTLALVPSPVCSTLVVFIPTKAGIVVAAETRQTAPSSVYCDGGKPKVIISARSRLAVGAITGTDKWYNFPGIPRDKVCEFIAHAAPVFDLAPVVETFLGEHTTSITLDHIEDLRGRCIRAFQAFFSGHPEVAAQTNSGELSQVLIATFDRKTLASSVWSFKVLVDNSSPTGGEVVAVTWGTVDKAIGISRARVNILTDT